MNISKSLRLITQRRVAEEIADIRNNGIEVTVIEDLIVLAVVQIIADDGTPMELLIDPMCITDQLRKNFRDPAGAAAALLNAAQSYGAASLH